MSAPLVWVALPVLVAASLFFLRRYRRITVILGVLTALFLALLAEIHPIGELITIGPFSYRLESTLSFFGRRFIFEDAQRPVLTLSYVLAGFWFGGAYITRTSRLFIPLGLVIVSLLTAALSVEPFLYAALIIELVVLVSIPLLSPPGQHPSRGVLRFLSFQTFALPFILFVGWMLAGVETSPGDTELVAQSMILIGVGFAFLLGIFPFHTWIPLLAEDVHPYVVSFLLFTLSWMVSLFGIGFFERYAWLRSSDTAFEMIRLAGMIMVLSGGVWAAFQNNLSRILGYGIMVEIGFSLLAIGVPGGTSIFFAMLLPRLVALGVWSFALSIIQAEKSPDEIPDLLLPSLRGVIYRLPVASSTIVLVILSIAGFPLLAAFPIRLSLWQVLAAIDMPAAILSFIGSASLIIAGLRSLITFIGDAEERSWQISESRISLLFLGVGLFTLILVGAFPQWFLPPLAEIAGIFGRLGP